MLIIIVSGQEFYDEVKEEFISSEDIAIKLEHSLVSLSKWESKFMKPFLSQVSRTHEEGIDYIKSMVIEQDFSDDVFERLSQKNFDLINDYISSKQSATTFVEPPQQKARGRSEIITSELIYFWMVSYNVPFECENWHLNRLFSLLKICNIKNSKERKMSKSEVAAQQRSLNAQRRAQLGSKG